jgi:hypothetical protein
VFPQESAVGVAYVTYVAPVNTVATVEAERDRHYGVRTENFVF